MERSSAAQLVGSRPGRRSTREFQATPPQGPGYSSRKTLHLRGGHRGPETPRGSQKHRETETRERERERNQKERDPEKKTETRERESNQREREPQKWGNRDPERKRDPEMGDRDQRGGQGLGTGLGCGQRSPGHPPATSLACLSHHHPWPPVQPHWKLLWLAPPARLTPHTAGSLTEHMWGTAQEGSVASVLFKMVKLRPRVPPTPTSAGCSHFLLLCNC